VVVAVAEGATPARYSRIVPLSAPLDANTRPGIPGAKSRDALRAPVPRLPIRPAESSAAMPTPEKVPVKASGRRGLADQVPF
jgi:hypothetical protein